MFFPVRFPNAFRSARLAAALVALAFVALPASSAHAQVPDLSMENAVDLPKMNNTDLWLAAIVGEVEEGVLIAKVLRPSAPVPVEEGDVIRSMNDKAVSAVASLKERFALLEEGERVTFVVLREGEETTLTYTHPDPSTLPRLELRRVD